MLLECTSVPAMPSTGLLTRYVVGPGVRDGWSRPTRPGIQMQHAGADAGAGVGAGACADADAPTHPRTHTGQTQMATYSRTDINICVQVRRP